MKYLQNLLFILTFVYSNASFSSIINPGLDISTPSVLTSSVEIIADFGTAGYNIEINDIFLDVTFSDNLFSNGETFGISWLIDPALRRERTLILNNGSSKSSLSIGFPNNLLINDDGLAYFNIFVSGGNGVNLTGITLTADATIQSVPLPNGIILFLSGLLVMGRKLVIKKNT